MHDARELTRHLADLLRRERTALSEFLVALAAFDRAKRWRDLGHTSLFVYLHRELGLSKAGAFYRKTAAELVQRYPEIIEPLRDGRLCMSSVTELAKVITPENRAEVLPRFFHLSKGEAKEIVVELNPLQAPARRTVVTAVRSAPAASIAPAQPIRADTAVRLDEPLMVKSDPVAAPACPESRPPARIEPLTADLRRIHLTVSKQFMAKLAAARDALSHSHPGADEEAILSAALDLLLDKHARTKGLVKKPRSTSANHSDRPRQIPAEVKRAVWTRDEGRCQYRLPSGRICGSTHRLELDHIVPVARGGASSIDNLRVLCRAHNDLAARDLFGDAWMDRCTARAPERAHRRGDAPSREVMDDEGRTSLPIR